MDVAWLMMQHPTANDYVVGTGKSYSVKEFLKIAFEEAGLGDYKKYIQIDPRYYRPAEVNDLVADATRTYRILKWKPKTTFRELVSLMVHADLKKYAVEK